MANNLLYLIHKPTGKSFILGKRMGEGWYQGAGWYKDAEGIAGASMAAKLEEFFRLCENDGDWATQDDFVLGMEDASGAPDCKAIHIEYHGDFQRGTLGSTVTLCDGHHPSSSASAADESGVA